METENVPALKLLNSYAPTLLSGLRENFPEHKAFFETKGKTLGDEVAKVDTAACLTALHVSLTICGRAIKASEQRTARTRSLAWGTSILTVLSSAGLMTVLATTAPKLVEYVIAAIALISSILTATVEHLTKGNGGGRIDVAYRSLVELFPDVVSTHARLTGLLRLPEWKPETEQIAKTLISTGNELCRKIQTAAATVGVAALTPQEADDLLKALPDSSILITPETNNALNALRPN